MGKQCPNCKSYKAYPAYSFAGLVTILGGSCFGCIFFFLLLPLIPFIWGLGAILIIVDLALVVLKKPRPFYCQKCNYRWEEKPENKKKK